MGSNLSLRPPQNEFDHDAPLAGAGISLLVPYRDDHCEGRRENWEWLRRHWEHVLPGAEIVVGDSDRTPFSKTCAVNAAFNRCSGDIIVVLDADCYIDYMVILDCAEQIRLGRTRVPVEPVWFIPYSHLYRLKVESTLYLISSDPTNPFKFDIPPDPEDVGSTTGSSFGHWFGALIQILPREAFVRIGGWDPRFSGWGGEDVASMLKTDTLFSVHRMTSNQVLTLWHTANGNSMLRTWIGQSDPRKNWDLAGRYRRALRDSAKMQKITDEYLNDDDYKYYRIDQPASE